MAYSDESSGKVSERFQTVPKVITDATTARTLAATDAGSFLICSAAGAVTVTIPLNATVAFPVGTVITVFAAGAGGVTIAGISGVTLTGTATAAQNICRKIIKTATNTWYAYV